MDLPEALSWAEAQSHFPSLKANWSFGTKLYTAFRVQGVLISLNTQYPGVKRTFLLYSSVDE